MEAMDEEFGGRQCNGKEAKSNVARLVINKETETVGIGLGERQIEPQFLNNKIQGTRLVLTRFYFEWVLGCREYRLASTPS